MTFSSVPQRLTPHTLAALEQDNADSSRADYSRPPLSKIIENGSGTSSSSSIVTIKATTPFTGSSQSTSPAATSSSRPKRKPIRKLQRPMTAPTLDDASRPPLLPSTPSVPRGAQSPTASAPSSERDHKVYGYTITCGVSPLEKQASGQAHQHDEPLFDLRLPHPTNAELTKAVEDTVMGGGGLTPDSSLTDVLSTSSPAKEQPPRAHGESPLLPIVRDGSEVEAKDWDGFLRAYAAGQWDPFNIPLPPKPSSTSPKPSGSPDMHPAPGGDVTATRAVTAPPAPSIAARRGAPKDSLELSDMDTSTAFVPFSMSPLPQSPMLAQLTSLKPEVKPESLRGDSADEDEEHHSHTSIADSSNAAATIRLAGGRIQLTPFSLPSPEKELMDPMSKLVTRATSTATSSRTKKDGDETAGQSRLSAICGSPRGSLSDATSGGGPVHPEPPSSPTSIRRGRDSGFFAVGPPLASISPFGTVTFATPSLRQTNHFSRRPSVTSVPIEVRGAGTTSKGEDYFARPVSTSNERGIPQDASKQSRQVGSNSSSSSGGSQTSPPIPLLGRKSRTPDPEKASASAQTLPSMVDKSWPDEIEESGDVGQTLETASSDRLATLVNAFSDCGTVTGSDSMTHVVGSSNNNVSGSSRPPLSTTVVSNGTSSRDTRVGSPESVASEAAISPPADVAEGSYADLGFLAPPLPPDEWARRQALHRVAHLAKLVFGAKMVVITLIDGAKQWHKSESGLGADEADRTISFCAHTILQRGDEPMVVLDATTDWRFRGNPLVAGPPNLRFYAGAPLRTMEGYNVGTLCVLDDFPRMEFNPRARHTLKEFAAIIVRELELWRDKIQLRIRDRIQRSVSESSRLYVFLTLNTKASSPQMEAFTRDCLEMDVPADRDSKSPASSMQRVYQQATTLVKETLGVNGALVLDVSHFEVMESIIDSDVDDGEPKRQISYHADLYEKGGNSPSPEKPLGAGVSRTSSSGLNGPGEQSRDFGAIPPLPILASDEDSPNIIPATTPLSGDEHAKLSKFLTTYTNGKIYERLPSCFRKMMPADIQYAMIVPIFGTDGRPFLLLCAYTLVGTAHYMEGYELQFLRAVGVIILSAVLKRKMVLADTSKSLFISNISHELRTPLHGILASAELLQDTRLNNTQVSYLKTVQSCAASLVETVNHVLDFTKLSGSANEGGKPNPIKTAKLDLKVLIDELVEGCWLGAQARAAGGTEDIGSVYAPPQTHLALNAARDEAPTAVVETVTDIGHRPQGWWIMSDAGGVRRILMNLVGNSIKFTSDGFIHVRLRELPHDLDAGKTMIEIAVNDSGKGISKDFLQNRMFQPFSQENPLHTGTGLGLAIVNSIGASLGGKVEVWSAEGVGTEIRLVTEVNLVDKREPPSRIVDPSQTITVSMIGFNEDHKGVALLSETMKSYLTDWWGFTISEDKDGIYGDILFVNEDHTVLEELTAAQESVRPVILLSAGRGNQHVATAIKKFERLGGWCRLVFKPSGPVRLGEAFSTAAQKLNASRTCSSSPASHTSSSYYSPHEHSNPGGSDTDDYFGNLSTTASSREPLQRLAKLHLPSSLNRRRSEGNRASIPRPLIGHRSSTFTPPTPLGAEFDSISRTPSTTGLSDASVQLYSDPEKASSTVELAEDGSVMLKSVVGSSDMQGKHVVLVVDDNVVNRNLLAHWLNKRGYGFQQACNGQEAIDIFNQFPPGYFEYWSACILILMDLSMPKKNGFEASAEIRKIEHMRRRRLASIEDKRKAFAAGVDGYLIKPVSLKTLERVFQRLKTG
ncbi:His Kinase A domain containing protein [Tulasnella sp. 330]|nr:His Kinase A domain containing protein [Tulasnella sp. 330]